MGGGGFRGGSMGGGMRGGGMGGGGFRGGNAGGGFHGGNVAGGFRGGNFGYGGFHNGFGSRTTFVGAGFGLGYYGGYYGGYGLGYGLGYGGYYSPYDQGYGYGYAEPAYYQPAYQPAITVVYPPQQQYTAPVYVEHARPQIREYDEYGQEVRPVAQPAATNSSPIYLFAFQDHVIRAAISYSVEGRTLHYVTLEHEAKQAPLDSVDRSLTTQLNRERRITLTLP
jgi:hypothetical protein